jgi:phosphatidylinositol alpha-mannosyltransferase
VFVSQVVRDFTLAQFPGPYRIIPNGIDRERFGSPRVEPIARFHDGRPNILFVGRLDKRKGFEHLIHAFPHIRHEFPDARLIVVGAFGAREKESFLRYARNHRIRSVHFVGYVSRQDLPRYYRTATLSCAPSTGFESFGMVLLEAMAAGVPIVASNIAGYRFVLTDNQEGKLVPPGDPEAIARACVALLRDPRARQRMGRAGRMTAARYDWAHVADGLLDYYEELLTIQRTRAKQVSYGWWNWQRPSWGVFE